MKVTLNQQFIVHVEAHGYFGLDVDLAFDGFEDLEVGGEVVRDYMFSETLLDLQTEIIRHAVLKTKVVKANWPFRTAVINSHELLFIDPNGRRNNIVSLLNFLSARLQQLVVHDESVILRKIAKELHVGL